METLSTYYEHARLMLLRVGKSVGTFVARHAPILGVVTAVLIFGIGGSYYGLHQPSAFFPVRSIVTVEEGASLKEIAMLLSEREVVRSGTAFMVLVTLQGGAESIKAGDYYFDHALTMQEVARRLVEGAFGLTPLTVTVPEGATTYQMAEIFEEKLVRFDQARFLTLASDKEGYLYPDTYQFAPNATTEEVVERLERTFYERLLELEADIATFGRPVHEIVTMASLLEKEAYRFEDKKLIAGVLWNRLRINMPLQVDAVFGYIERRGTFSPHYSDLEVESPYNTYKNSGLPPGPIGSPSVASLEAAVRPEETDSLFYLHGHDGSLHLAQTYDQHLINKSRYLW